MGKILVVHRSMDQCSAFERLLKTAGYEVSRAVNEAEAMAAIEQQVPDLLLLDGQLNAGDSCLMLERLHAREATRVVPVIVLAAPEEEPAHKIRALENGASDYLVEPVNHVELLAKTRALLRGKQVQDDLRRANAQLRAMLDITQATNTLDLQMVAERLVEQTLEVAELQVGGLWILEHDELVCLAQRGYSNSFIAQRSKMALDTTELFRKALDAKTPIYGRTAELYDPSHPVAAELGWVIVVPLIARLLPVGLLQLGSREERALTPSVISFIMGVANLAADAVQNARLYEETESQRRQLADLDRQKDEFISVASHELKNPMASIKGYAGLLLRRAQRDPELKAKLKGLELIDQQIGRMTTLLDQLLDVSRISMDRMVVEPSKRDLAALVRQQIQEASRHDTTHQISLICDEPVVECEFDHFRMVQVIANMLNNAIKYSPSGGTIIVTLRREGEQIVLSVADQGVGIPSEQQDKLFQRFFRASNAISSFTGLGLGLCITREIVSKHGGSISVESAEGQGAAFTVRLPAELPEALRLEMRAQREAAQHSLPA